MSYSTEAIATNLKEARLAKGISQRELSNLSGVPQAQISRIEAGTVDPRTTSLLALAHALDMELALVSRKAVPAVRTISRQSSGQDSKALGQARKEWNRISESLRVLQMESPALDAVQRLQKSFADLQRFQVQFAEPESLKRLRQALEKIKEPPKQLEALNRSQDLMRNLRNQLAHSPGLADSDERVRPAYSLDEDDDA